MLESSASRDRRIRKAAAACDGPPQGSVCGSGGLIRGRVGPGATLADAFAVLEEDSSDVAVMRHPVRNLRGARIGLDPADGSGYYDLTRIGSELFVIVGNFAYKNPRVELVPGDGRIQFYFKLSGDLTFGVSRTEPLRLNRPSLLVYKQPTGVDLQEWTAPSALERCVAITFSPEYLTENFLTSRSGALPELALPGQHADQFKYMRRPLTASMFELAAVSFMPAARAALRMVGAGENCSKLVDNPYEGHLRLVYIEAVTLELLCALPACRKRPADEALKHGFKAVFGETLFEFSVRCRMQHALKLLRERSMPVARIAESVGYSHQTSFATAFRRHFGMSPRDVRPVKPR